MPLRAQVELQSRQQQLIVARNDYAKQKLTVARVIGLPPGQEFTLTEKAPYAPFAFRSDWMKACNAPTPPGRIIWLPCRKCGRRNISASRQPPSGYPSLGVRRRLRRHWDQSRRFA